MRGSFIPPVVGYDSNLFYGLQTWAHIVQLLAPKDTNNQT